MKEGHSINYEQEFLFSDNKLHSVNISKALIKTDKDPAYMLFSGWDVTELKAIQRKFQTANNQLAMVMDAGEIISWVWDVRVRTITFDYDYQKNQDYLPEMKSLTKPLEDVLSLTHPDDVERSL